VAPAKGLVFVLFLRDDLEILVESHFELAILALDVVGLIAVGGGVEIVGLDGATDLCMCLGRDVVGHSRQRRGKASTSAPINILVMGDSLKGRKLSATSPRRPAIEKRTELVLFLLAGDLEVLVERHVVLAVLALDIVGLLALALGDDVGLFHRAPNGLDRRLDAFHLLLGQCRRISRTCRDNRESAAIKILFMDIPPREHAFIERLTGSLPGRPQPRKNCQKTVARLESVAIPLPRAPFIDRIDSLPYT
jgi:hypothetical protein